MFEGKILLGILLYKLTFPYLFSTVIEMYKVYVMVCQKKTSNVSLITNKTLFISI